MTKTAVYESLSIVAVYGFEPAKPETMVDPPGSANYLVDLYGMPECGEFDPEEDGIIWTDYDGPGWRFTVLIDSREVDAFKAMAEESGYSIDSVEEVGEPVIYGDGQGTVAVCKHPDGWIIVGG
jgi:hypothetical protein